MDLEHVEQTLVKHKLTLGDNTDDEVKLRFSSAVDFIHREAICAHEQELNMAETVERACTSVVSVNGQRKFNGNWEDDKPLWRDLMRRLMHLTDELTGKYGFKESSNGA